MTTAPNEINWDARKNAVNAEKAEWLDKNCSHLKLLQSHITRAWDEYHEYDGDDAETAFILDIKDAIPSLIKILCDLRQQDFIEQAKAKHPEAF